MSRTVASMSFACKYCPKLFSAKTNLYRHIRSLHKDLRDIEGYANEVGEAFRALVPVSVVWASYLVASGYVVADAAHKGNQAKEMQWKTESVRTKKILHAIGDTIIWQGLASVAIPGFTINRICAISQLLLRKTTSLPAPVRKWTTTAVGLAMIPIIITPIDRSVDYFMNNSVRKWYHIEEEEEKIVHHTR